SHVLAGLADTGEDALRLLNARWRVSVDQPADVVVASVSGDASRHTFAELAQALACAARVVQPQGKIVLLSQARPALGEAAELLRQADDPAQGLQLLREHKGIDRTAAFQWASAARRANLYLLSELPPETAEELFVTPLEQAGQIQRLLSSAASCLIVADAHKML